MLRLFFFDNNLFMTIKMKPLLPANKSFQNKYVNPFDFQQIMDYESNDPDLMVNLKLLVCLVTLLMNFHSPLIVF